MSELEVLERMYSRTGDMMHSAHEGPWRKRMEQRLAELKKRK